MNRKDVLRQAFGAEAPVFLLCHFKNQLAHAAQVTGFGLLSQEAGSLAG
jgi:hypothetical protein